MRAKPIPMEEQYKLVLECRQSGLSDYHWCLEHDIKPGTFYNWVKRLRKAGTYTIPAPRWQRHVYSHAQTGYCQSRTGRRVCKDSQTGISCRQ